MNYDFMKKKLKKLIFNIKYLDFNKMLSNFQKVKKSNSIQIILENLDLL